MVNKVDEKVFKESLNKINKDIEKQINTINDMKNNIVNKEILKKEINEYDIKKNLNLKENEIIKQLRKEVNIINEKIKIIILFLIYK